MLKKGIAFSAFAVLCCSLFISCAAGQDYKWVVKIDGREIPPNMFVTAQMQSYIEAQMIVVGEGGRNVMESEINGVPAEQWINEKSIQHLKNFCFIEKEFDKRGLVISDEAEDFLNTFGKSGWENISRIYEENNIPMEYYLQYLDHLCKEQMVFNDIYMDGGEKEVSEEEINRYLCQRLCRVSVFTLSKTDSEGRPLPEDDLRRLKRHVEDTVDAINKGLDIQTAARQSRRRLAEISRAEYDRQRESSVKTFYLNSNNIDAVPVFTNELFCQKEGRCIYYETDENFYICQKVDFESDNEEYFQLKQSVVNKIKADEFQKFIRDSCDAMQVEINQKALEYYSPSKIKITIGG